MGRRALLAGALGLCASLAQAGDLEPAKLQRLVEQDCGSCHGLSLSGGLGRDITPARMQEFDLEVLQSIILDGIPGTAMPPWRPLLSEPEARWIAEFLQSGG